MSLCNILCSLIKKVSFSFSFYYSLILFDQTHEKNHRFVQQFQKILVTVLIGGIESGCGWPLSTPNWTDYSHCLLAAPLVRCDRVRGLRLINNTYISDHDMICGSIFLFYSFIYIILKITAHIWAELVSFLAYLLKTKSYHWETHVILFHHYFWHLSVKLLCHSYRHHVWNPVKDTNWIIGSLILWQNQAEYMHGNHSAVIDWIVII